MKKFQIKWEVYETETNQLIGYDGYVGVMKVFFITYIDNDSYALFLNCDKIDNNHYKRYGGTLFECMNLALDLITKEKEIF